MVSINASRTERVQLPEDGKVSMMFNLPEVCAINLNIVIDLPHSWNVLSVEILED